MFKMLHTRVLTGDLSGPGEYTLLSSSCPSWGMGRELLSGEQAGNRLVLSVWAASSSALVTTKSLLV